MPRGVRTAQRAVPIQRATPYAMRPQQFLYFLPLPQGHGSLRPTLGNDRRIGRSIDTSPAPSPSPSPPTAAIAPRGWRMRASAGPRRGGGGSSPSGGWSRAARRYFYPPRV